ncbi:hypothetical protein ACT4MK_01175 (plasmid) [Bradyrhizobium barranii]|uniref:hypothetical protein n=1 Tax=Bradyrhizobium TaxID=374 RepID=UPI003F296446
MDDAATKSSASFANAEAALFLKINDLLGLERDLARDERDRFARIVAHVSEVLHGSWPAEAKIRNLIDHLDGHAPEKTPERGGEPA